MSARLAVMAIVAALSLVACGSTPPNTAPVTTDQAASTTPTRSPANTPPTSPSTSPDAGPPIDDAAYRAGDAFTLSVGDAGADWTAPSAAPVMPNGQPAARVAFLPASCATGDFSITTDPAPEDTWETDLQEDGDQQGYEYMSWPAAQVAECADGQGSTYLEVAYHPFTPDGTIHLAAAVTNVDGAPAAVEVVPVFTAADATQPSLTTDGFIAFNSAAGPEKPRSATATALSVSGFARASLPDRSAPTHWRLELTGCGPVGPKPIVITATVGGEAPVEVGTCSDGAYSSDKVSMALPADGTPVAVLMAGGTTKSQVRVSEFQWRGDRP